KHREGVGLKAASRSRFSFRQEMGLKQIEDPTDFLGRSGNLHDVRVESIEFDVDTQTLRLALNDINASFSDTPEYQGFRATTLIFGGVLSCVLDLETSEGVRISHASISAQGPRFRLEMDLNLGGGFLTGGRASIAADFESLRTSDR